MRIVGSCGLDGQKRHGIAGNLVRLAAMMVLGGAQALAQAPQEPLRIGVLTDLNGPNSIYTGDGSVVAARMAVADFGGSSRGAPSKSSPPPTRTSRISARPWPGAGSTSTTSPPSSTCRTLPWRWRCWPSRGTGR